MPVLPGKYQVMPTGCAVQGCVQSDIADLRSVELQIAGRCVEFKVPVRLGSFGKQDIESVGGSAVVPHSDRASLPERVGDIRRTGTALGARPTITGLAAVGRSAALNGKQLAELCAAGKQSAAVVRFKGYGHGKTVIQLHLRIRHTRLTVACRTDTDHAERVHHIGIHMLDGQHDRCSVLPRHSRSYTCAVIKQVLLCHPDTVAVQCVVKAQQQCTVLRAFCPEQTGRRRIRIRCEGKPACHCRTVSVVVQGGNRHVITRYLRKAGKGIGQLVRRDEVHTLSVQIQLITKQTHIIRRSGPGQRCPLMRHVGQCRVSRCGGRDLVGRVRQIEATHPADGCSVTDLQRNRFPGGEEEVIVLTGEGSRVIHQKVNRRSGHGAGVCHCDLISVL